MLVEGQSFERGEREAQQIIVFLVVLQRDFGQVQCHQTGIDMGVYSFGRASLTVH